MNKTEQFCLASPSAVERLSTILEIYSQYGAKAFSLSKQKKRAILEAWTEFLQRQDWQYFITFTFKDHIHPEAADKLFRVWLNKLNRHLYGQRWRKHPAGGIKWVRALEYQKRGVLHYHALVANCGYVGSAHIRKIWTDLSKKTKAGFIKVDIYSENKGGAEAYIVKYVTKDADIELSPNFQYQIHTPDHEHRRTQHIDEVANS